MDVARYVRVAHARGLSFRLDELNSVACGGRRHVSDTFASALWMLDALLELARTGVDGVNVHTFPHAAYEPFSFSRRAGRWQADVHPEYYGLLMFARAAPPGSRILSTRGGFSDAIKRWAILAPDGTLRVVLINKGDRPRHIGLRSPPRYSQSGLITRLVAPTPFARSDVTIGGQGFGTSTSTGVLSGQSRLERVAAQSGVFPITLPAWSATMLTLQLS